MAIANVFYKVEEQLYTVMVMNKPVTVRLTGEVHKDNEKRLEVQIMHKDKKEQRLMYVLEEKLIPLDK